MAKYIRAFIILAIVIAIAIINPAKTEQVLKPTIEDISSYGVIVGKVINRQRQAIADAEVQAMIEGSEEPVAETVSQADGSFILHIPDSAPDGGVELSEILINRHHYETMHVVFNQDIARQLNNSAPIILPDTTIYPDVNVGFWIATAVFAFVLGVIALGMLQNTLAALAGAAVIFAVSYLGPVWNSDLYIFHFDEAIEYIDWNVIFLIMGMMLVIAIIEHTGIFQWLAFKSYQISGGKIWLLLIILMLVTGTASAFLDNVTTMLLMAPITIQIAISLGVHPFSLLMPEIFASNVVGISTLVGTPTNILIGSYANISFSDFLVNLTPGVIIAMAGLVGYSLLIYKKDLKATRSEEVAKLLYAKLEENATISKPEQLKKAGWVGLGMIILFVFGEGIHLMPSVTAIMGAAAMLIWIQPDMEETIQAVDWTTLLFFMALFICVGAIQEVGLINVIADFISNLVGDSLLLATLALIWFSAILSTVIANIPFTAAMLPVVGYLTATIPGADTKVLFFALSVGAAMGGNGSLIGASANMVASGIAEKSGYPITYSYFFKKGFPALLITTALATGWILLKFLM